MIGYFGYGHVAGFLFQKGVIAPNARSTGNLLGDDIDPITGLVRRSEEELSYLKFTDEEKEIESNRLFVLFEKLNKTGVIKVATSSNPKIQEL